MRLRRLAAVVAAAGVVAVLAGASGDSTKAGTKPSGPDLSTVDAAKAYLVSQGLNPSQFVFQVGLKNYAGSACPGLDWNCTAAPLVVQIAPGGGVNYAECGVNVRQCVIVQGGHLSGPSPLSQDDINMNAHCGDEPAEKRLTLKDSGSLTCTITQSNPTTGNNHAVVGMSIHDNDGNIQEAHEDATVTQSTTGDGNNYAVVQEEIVLDTHDESAGTQMQDGFQSLNLVQDTETGDNSTNVKQTQGVTAHADGAATTQKQNTLEVADECDPGPSTNANTCIRFQQTSDTGRNDLDIHQDHNVSAVGAGGQQNQGCASKQCTLEVDGVQGPTSRNSVDDDQGITYTLRGPDGTTQIQDPRIANGPGLQSGGLWKVGQLAVLTANDADDVDDVQAHINQVDDTSTGGTVDAQSVIILNGARSEVVCNASSCFYIQACGDVGEAFCPDFSDETPID